MLEVDEPNVETVSLMRLAQCPGIFKLSRSYPILELSLMVFTRSPPFKSDCGLLPGDIPRDTKHVDQFLPKQPPDGLQNKTFICCKLDKFSKPDFCSQVRDWIMKEGVSDQEVLEKEEGDASNIQGILQIIKSQTHKIWNENGIYYWPVAKYILNFLPGG